MAGRFELFSDGACSGNPGPGAWAFILRGDGIDGEIAKSGFEAATTNNRMELMAIIQGLEAVSERGAVVDVVSDSEYAVKGLTEWLDGWKSRGWKNSRREPVKNDDLWKRLDELRSRHRLQVSWVRGHEDHPENNRCDRMAV
ncbi:MAG: ribonuclease HI, partial [Phycisphaerae bacterium]|nr:ribonuclease HI [Phycisphaerae bacterium]